MKLTVLVPTYRRPDDLSRCLSALLRQQRTPDEIVVVARADDEATHACLAEHVTPACSTWKSPSSRSRGRWRRSIAASRPRRAM